MKYEKKNECKLWRNTNKTFNEKKQRKLMV